MCVEVWCGLQSETCAKFSLSNKCILNCVLQDKVRDVGKKLKFGYNYSALESAVECKARLVGEKLKL